MSRVIFSLLFLSLTFQAHAGKELLGSTDELSAQQTSQSTCADQLTGKRMSFGNVQALSDEMQTLRHIFTQKTDSSINPIGTLALFLSLKGVPLDIAVSPGHVTPLFWADANELLLSTLQKGTLVGSALERTEIFDIRLNPKVYVYWAGLALRTLVTITKDRFTSQHGQIFLKNTDAFQAQDFLEATAKELNLPRIRSGSEETTLIGTRHSPWQYDNFNKLGDKQEEILIKALNMFTASELEALLLAQLSGSNVSAPHSQDVGAFEKDFAARIEILMAGGFNGATARAIAKMMEESGHYMNTVKKAVMFNSYLDWSEERLEKFRQAVFNSSMPENYTWEPAPLSAPNAAEGYDADPEIKARIIALLGKLNKGGPIPSVMELFFRRPTDGKVSVTDIPTVQVDPQGPPEK